MRCTWIVVLLCLLPTVVAFDVTVPQTAGTNEPFTVTVVLNEQSPIDSQTPLILLYNGETKTFKIKEIAQGNFTILPEENKIGNQVLQTTITLGNLPQAAIDFTQAKEITNLSFSITSTNAKNIALDLNNDKTIDWIFQGKLLENQFTPLDTSYLKNFERDTQVEIKGTDVYCEKTLLNATERFKIEAKVKQNAPATLLGIISTLPNPTCDPNAPTEQTQCCVLQGITSSFGNVSCTINRKQQTTQEGYICVATRQTGNTNYFSLAVESQNAGKVAAYHGITAGTTRDYLIRGYYNEYEKTLNATKEITIDPTQLQSKPTLLKFSGEGQITLHNLAAEVQTDLGTQILNKFTEITARPEQYNGSITLIIPLIAPNTAGKVPIEISLMSATKKENITIIPRVQFSIIAPSFAAPMQEISFTSSQVQNISSYVWDFGDGTQGFEKKATHQYATQGNYTVTLTITDTQETQQSTQKQITIGSLKEYLTQEIPNMQEEITFLQTSIPEEIVDTLTTLKYQEKLIQAQEKLLTMQLQLTSNATENTYSQLKSEVDILKATIIKDLQLTTQTYDAHILSINDIPSSALLQIDATKEAIFASQQAVTVNAKTHIITASYLDGTTETFALITKEMFDPVATIYELPEAPIKEILTEGYDVAQPNAIYLWQPGTTKIAYTTQIIGQNVRPKTLLIPPNVAEFVEEEITIEETCGDGFCSENEDCPKDCEPKRPWGWIIFIIIFFALAVYYINFYKGPFALHFLHRKPKSSQFKTSGDELAITRYIKDARRKGFTDQQISFVLKSKRWTDAQIREGFTVVAKEVTGRKGPLLFRK